MAAKRATISDLPVNTAGKLTGEMKRALIKIVEDEFENQTASMQSAINEAKRKEVEAWRKEHNIDKLLRDLRKIEARHQLIVNELHRAGVETDGSIREYHMPKELTARLTKAVAAYSEPRTTKNKINARLWMANTYGEAMVILNEVMGNTLIPNMRLLPDGSLERSGDNDTKE